LPASANAAVFGPTVKAFTDPGGTSAWAANAHRILPIVGHREFLH
jgi:hypothetical protein